MLEHIVHIGPMLLVGGLAAGWVAEAVSRRGYGLIPDMVLGLIGSVIGGGAVWVVGAGEGMLAMFLIGCGAAALMIGAQRGLWRPTPVVAARTS
jgi:uncharacterized membrane protein YeaQ/YmgE (transglycosylase-associated protein family)